MVGEIGAAHDGGSRNDTAAAPLVSIIVLTYNQVAYTRACFASLARHTVPSYELIVVDNASTDGTRDYLRTVAGARLVLNDANRGFAGGCNQGLALMRGRYALLLNNDTLLPEGWLERLLGAIDRPAAGDEPPAGIAGPRSNSVAGVQVIQHAGYDPPDPDAVASVQEPAGPTGAGTPHPLVALNDFARAFARQRRGRAFAVDRVIGFCMLIRREVVARVGGLDERFGSGNFEDDDYCLRTRLAGYRIVVADDCFVHHYGGRTFAGNRIDYRSSMDRNLAIFRQKWGLPATPVEQGYRAVPLLSRPFDPARDYVPLPPPPPVLAIPGTPPPPVPPEAPDTHPALEEGKRRLGAGDVAGAIRQFADAAAALPSSAMARYFLGCAQFEAGDSAAAAGTLSLAAALDPASTDVATALGAAQAASGDYVAARTTLMHALEIDARNAEAWFQLGDACRRAGWTDEARLALEQALRLEPAHGAAQDSFELL
jgi:GT2 family glycosyltransferase